MMNDNKEWLENIKVGDKVAVISQYCETIVEVNRLTNTQIIVGTDNRFRKDTGHKVGSSGTWYGRNYITPVTDKIIQKIESVNLKRKISNIDFSKLPTEKIKAILAILEGK